MVRAGTRRPLVGVVAGILGPAVLANGMAYRFPRLGGRTTPAAGRRGTYWVWGPGGGAFDYPFADWRGPHGGWGNP